jgi:hypothetical protein
MMTKFTRTIVLILSIAAFAANAQACDLCGCYTPQLDAFPQVQEEVPFRPPGVTAQHATRSWIAGLYGAIGEQFTHFGTVQVDGREVNNPSGQYEDSSITQLVAGYAINSRFALQLNVPSIYRSFERPEGFAIDRGSESGLGDVSLLAKVVLFHANALARTEIVTDGKNTGEITHEPDFTFSAVALVGVKFPTGDSSRLKEEFNEVEIPGAPESGIHGHDLTLGTGSYDGIFGGQTSIRYKNFFFQADSQFALRGDGPHQYHFANDLSWSGGPGYYFVRNRQTIVGLQFVCSGEHKDVDRFRGQPAEDTGITSVFLGPRVIVSRGKLSAEFAAELPVSIDNTALQAVPDYRLRASFAFRF